MSTYIIIIIGENMKKGFISITIIYSFLLVFLFTLLLLLSLYTQKSRFVDSIVYEAKQQIYLKKEVYQYNGRYYLYKVPKDGYYFIEAYGAQGGDITTQRINNPQHRYNGGRGGYVSGYIYLLENEKLYIYVGGQGEGENENSQNANYISTGGYNGGGSGKNNPSSSGRVATGGGGASDVRYFGTNYIPSSSELEWDSTLGLNSRIMVAGGGGGAFSCIVCNAVHWGANGHGGNLNGADGEGKNAGNEITASTGGTQTGVSFGKGMDGETERPGGGGGYYGGNNYSFTAGGGSSFISGYEGCNAITNATDRTHTSDPNHYSGKIFNNGTMRQGVRRGNGEVSIEFVGDTVPGD